MKRSHVSSEPIWWAPFSAGGMIAALLVPIHIIIFAILVPLGFVELSASGLEELLEFQLVGLPLTKIYLFVFVGGCLFHWGHRFRYALLDLGIHGGRSFIAVMCYGSAILGTIWAGRVLFFS